MSAGVKNLPEDRAAMSFLEHLQELRQRLLRILIALIGLTSLSLVFTEPLLKLLIQPYGQTLQAIGPTESISIYLRVALMAGAALGMPYILWELWGFIAPGLYPNERWYVYWVLPAAFISFLGGMVFAWFVMLPTAIGFLSNFAPDIFQVEWTAERYIPFVTSLLFWISVSFETPLIIFFLAKLRIVNARMLWRAWRYAIVAIAILAAVITPTVDPFNMGLVMLPLIALYFVSILLAALA